MTNANLSSSASIADMRAFSTSSALHKGTISSNSGTFSVCSNDFGNANARNDAAETSSFGREDKCANTGTTTSVSTSVIGIETLRASVSRQIRNTRKYPQSVMISIAFLDMDKIASGMPDASSFSSFLFFFFDTKKNGTFRLDKPSLTSSNPFTMKL